MSSLQAVIKNKKNASKILECLFSDEVMGQKGQWVSEMSHSNDSPSKSDIGWD